MCHYGVKLGRVGELIEGRVFRCLTVLLLRVIWAALLLVGRRVLRRETWPQSFFGGLPRQVIGENVVCPEWHFLKV